MAIPIRFPSSDDDADERQRNFDRLLGQIWAMLGQLREIQLGRPHQRSLHRRDLPLIQRRSAVERIPVMPPVMPPVLPPVMPVVPTETSRLEDTNLDADSAAMHKVHPQSQAQAGSVSTWTEVGAELRRTADTFRAERATEQNTNKSRLKRDSFILYLFSERIWCTVAILIHLGFYCWSPR